MTDELIRRAAAMHHEGRIDAAALAALETLAGDIAAIVEGSRWPGRARLARLASRQEVQGKTKGEG